MASEFDELIKSLNARLSEAEKDKLNLNVALRKEREERKRLRKQLDDLVETADTELNGLTTEKTTLAAELESLRAKLEATPSETSAEIDRLKGEIQTRDIKDRFRSIEADLADGFTLDDVFHHAKFDPKGVKPDEVKPDELARAWRDAKPGLFKPAPAPDGHSGGSANGNGNGASRPKPPLLVDGQGRGARDAPAGTVKYTRDEIAKPGWEKKNPPLDAALKAGTARLESD